jgi:hypothetical protein
MTVFAGEPGVVVDDVAVDTGFSGVSTAGWRVAGTRRDRQGVVACFFWGVDGCSETVQAGGAGFVNDNVAVSSAFSWFVVG